MNQSFGTVARRRQISPNAVYGACCSALWSALWSKTLFFVGTCALIVAAANSEINPIAVEAAGFESRIRCTGSGIMYFPTERLLVVDQAPFRFRPEEVTGRFPGEVTLRDRFTGEAFVIRAQRSDPNHHSIDRISDPNFEPRDLDCTAVKEVM